MRGIVIPVAWDEQGNVIATAIFDHDENEYLVDKTGRGEEFLSLIRQEIEAKGVVTERADRKIFTISEYNVRVNGQSGENLDNQR